MADTLGDLPQFIQAAHNDFKANDGPTPEGLFKIFLGGKLLDLQAGRIEEHWYIKEYNREGEAWAG